MSLENPTRLSIGMRGNFAGRDFRLLGRVVMGVEISGEIYYWNEFNLQAESGESATLVFEDSDQGGEWRLFTMFEPESPMTAADAVTKQVGDRLNLNGTDVTVTLVSSSRVYRIEGLPPEGVQVGSEANYFNAEAGDVMQVVSWTGQEVEYYNGLTLGVKSVETAFNLPPQPAAGFFSGLRNRSSADDSGNRNYAGTAKFLIQIGVVVLILFFIFGRGFSCSRGSESGAMKPVFAPPSLLVEGMAGHWGGKNFHVTAHAVVEIDQVEAIYERNEYELTDDLGQVAWLVCGDRPDSKDWTLFTPLTPVEPPTPQASATQKVGDTVNIDGLTGTIHNLFRYTVRHLETTGSSGWHAGDVQYGYAAQSDYNLLEVRWNNSGISCYRGKNIPAKDVKGFVAAFTAAN